MAHLHLSSIHTLHMACAPIEGRRERGGERANNNKFGAFGGLMAQATWA